MIFGIGVDLVEVQRFKKWVENPEILSRWFNEKEMIPQEHAVTERRISALCQHYAVRFAAKEAFSKALGTGISGFSLKDVFILNEESGKPHLVLEHSAKEIFDRLCPGAVLHVSLSHERAYATAYVVIEK